MRLSGNVRKPGKYQEETNMPAFYAHRKFGASVTEALSEEMIAVINNHRTQFDLGCQGPDIFFFYRPWGTNAVNKYGNQLHEDPAKELFERGAKIIRKYGQDSAQAAYVYGVVCHFSLDSECHPYVAEMIEKTGVAHIEIEEEFEKYVMRIDGVNPFSTDLSKMVPTDRETVDAVKPLYPAPAWGEVRESLVELKVFKKIICQPSAKGQERINRLLKLTGMYEVHKGQMNQMVDNLACTESNAGLWERFLGAVSVAASLIEDLNASAKTGKPLSVRFERNFE